MQHTLATRSRACVFSQPRTTRLPSVVCKAAAQTVSAPAKFVPTWKECYADLKAKGLKTVAPEEAVELLATGKWVLLDVRRPDQHVQSHPEGCINVPMYRLIDMSKMDFQKAMKVIAYSFNGVQAIDSNSDFVQEAKAAVAGKKIITMCEAGGTMRATVNFPLGKPSRSLQAAYKLMAEGGFSADDVLHLERGVYGWFQADLPIVGDYEPDLGRTPMAAADPTLQNAAQSAGYEMKQGDKALEQPAKKNWFGF